jgi:hypothetical protein
MTITAPVIDRIVSNQIELDLAPEKFGLLRDSSDLVQNAPALRGRMESDGYLFLPGLLNRDEVLAARREVALRLQSLGQLEPGTDPMECIAAQGVKVAFNPDVAVENPALLKVLYEGPMMAFWEHFLGEPVRHFDYTWFRTVTPGPGTPSHTDAVYMNRGTQRLFTAWTPIGDIPLHVGGLMVLEGSHRHQKLRENYSSKDVDSFCSNRVGESYTGMGGGGNIRAGGHLSKNARTLRDAIGGRWLTTPEYRAGDVLVFSIFTVHASLDNQSNQIRLSSDSRYQAASEPVDERWVGPIPIGHGPAGKRGMIC